MATSPRKKPAPLTVEQKHSVVFGDPDVLKIPQEVHDWIKESGYNYRWLNHIMPDGSPNSKNIGLKFREGWTFLNVGQIPDMYQEAMQMLFEIGQYGPQQGIICVGDLALAIMPTELAEARHTSHVKRAVSSEQDIEKITSGKTGNRAFDRKVERASERFPDIEEAEVTNS